MIALTAKINLISGNNGTLTDVTKADVEGQIAELVGNNISSSTPLGSKKTVKNPFNIGSSKLGDGSTFSGELDYFIGSQLTNESGEFEYPYVFNVNGENISALTIAFDDYRNIHPTAIGINDVPYIVDDAIFTVKLPTANSHKITIVDLNEPNRPLVISGIYVEISIVIDKRNLISLSRSIFDRSDYKLPSYGVISNSGNIEFKDIDGEIRDYAEQMLLTSDLKVTISLNNTLKKGASEQIGAFETRDWDYDDDNRAVTVSLIDDLEEWQDIIVEGINYNAKKPESKTMEYFYNYLHSKTPEKYNMLSFAELDEKTREVISGTVVQYPLLESGNLWQQWTKFCEVCALYIYQNNQKKTVCSYTYGS